MIDIIKEIVSEHLHHRKQIAKLAKSDIIKTYTGAALGWMWAIIKPAVTIFVFYFAFSIGLKEGNPIEGYPYFLWLIAGMIPWFYMRDMLTAGANSIRRYKFLVTKIKYPISTIPTFVSIAHLIMNMLLIVIMLIIFICYGKMPDIYWMQLPIYIVMMFLFFTAWALFAGMLSAISSDFLNLVKSITQAFFWLSGIMYDVNKINIDILREIMLFNPITIIANGFRNTLVYKTWFWETGDEMRNFLLVYAVMIIASLYMYKKLNKEIRDVL